jgi:hypothetical protein
MAAGREAWCLFEIRRRGRVDTPRLQNRGVEIHVMLRDAALTGLCLLLQARA